MKNTLLCIFSFLWISLTTSAQEIQETNTDIIYQQGLENYKNQNYGQALRLTQRGLELAPEYHDIRILQVRVLWALEQYPAADEDLDFLLEEAPEYVDVKPLALQRIKRYPNPSEALGFIEELESSYPDDPELQLQKAQLLLTNKQRKESRETALSLFSREGITGEQRYALQNILNRTISDEIGITYQHLAFSEDYSRSDSWNSLALEYQHNFHRTAVIARVNYTDRSYADGYLYELEAYPVFSDRLYAYTNIGFSESAIFPDLRANASVYYNFAKILEGEVGGRLLSVNDTNFFTGILGLSMYQGKFLFNARTFLGPERNDKLIQNYQANVRYYLRNAENYLLLKAGSGIAPEERNRAVETHQNPSLQAFYTNVGIRRVFWSQHVLQLEAGYLFEDITSSRTGKQMTFNAGYRYRF